VVAGHDVDLGLAVVELRAPLQRDVVGAVAGLVQRGRRVAGQAVEVAVEGARVAEARDLELVVLGQRAVDLGGEEVGLAEPSAAAAVQLLDQDQVGVGVDVGDAVAGDRLVGVEDGRSCWCRAHRRRSGGSPPAR
jgi:hypothetical protein